jgi:streptogramin lyase
MEQEIQIAARRLYLDRMQALRTTDFAEPPLRTTGLRSWSALLAAVALLGCAHSALAQATVQTVGGGRLSARGSDAGFVNGDTIQASQFNLPFGAAVDSFGNVYVADRNNGAIRKIDLDASRVSTLVSGLDHPVALTAEPLNELFILSQGAAGIVKYDRFGNLIPITGRFTDATALASDGRGLLYVTQTSGVVSRVNASNGTIVTLATGLSEPMGIAILNSGLIAVSDTGNNRLLLLDPVTGTRRSQIGAGIVLPNGPASELFRDGSTTTARFNRPHHLALARNGDLLVADRGNHRVRIVGSGGLVSTLYGISPDLWEGPECVGCNPIILPGWLDGSVEFAEAREPIGVAVAPNGNIYTTEAYYHLVREITPVATPGGGSGGGANTNIVVLPPTISPGYGYFPMGHTITVLNPNTNSFLRSVVYYTIDGTDPTTNSLQVAFPNGIGTIFWRETQRDLTSLRLKAFLGANASSVTSGQPSPVSEIGITRDIFAGPGSTLIVPVQVNLRTNDTLKSLQYRVEITSASPDAPKVGAGFEPLSISTNDFIPVVTSTEEGGASSFMPRVYETPQARGVSITFIGTNSNFSVEGFAVVGMLSIPIPHDAPIGSRYSVQVFNPSGTSDGKQADVLLESMAASQILVTNTTYLVGDSAPSIWYNAELGRDHPWPDAGFGDGALRNNDVNNAFSAALGVRVPFPSSDLFDALDVFPEDSAAAPGGDGLIRFLDWQVVLLRALGLSDSSWERVRTAGGARIARRPGGADISPNLSVAGTSQQPSNPGSVWVRQAFVSGSSLEDVGPGAPIDIPIYVVVAPGYRVAGLAFRATLEGAAGAPAIQTPLQFIAPSGSPSPVQGIGPSPNVLLCGWPLVPSPSFEPALQNSNLLGYIRCVLPTTARPGQVYTLHFANADGSPDLQTQYEIETKPVTLWVQTLAKYGPAIISDEWKVRFFGNLTNPSALADADPDLDGVNNLQEYLAGTDPKNRLSALRLETPLWDSVQQNFVLRWISAPGKKYSIEAATDLANPRWTALTTDLAGDGQVREWRHRTSTAETWYYRLRLEP